MVQSLDYYPVWHLDDVRLRLLPLTTPLLYFTLPSSLLIFTEQVCIAVKHGSGLVARNFHAILFGTSRLPHLMSGTAPEIVEDFADVLGQFPVLTAPWAPSVSVYC